MTAVVIVGTVLFACTFVVLGLLGRSIGESMLEVNKVVRKDLPNLHGRIDTLQDEVDDLRKQVKSNRLT